MKVTPTKHDDGTETVKLYGKTIDVTGKKKFTVFKREYVVDRPKAKKTLTTREAYDIVQGDHSVKTVEVAEDAE